MTIIVMMMMIMMIKVVGEDQVKILPKSPMGERSLVPQVPSVKYRVTLLDTKKKSPSEIDRFQGSFFGPIPASVF